MLTIELAVDDRRGRYRWDGAKRGDSCCVNEYCEMDGVEVAEAKLSIDFRGLTLLISVEEAGRVSPGRYRHIAQGTTLVAVIWDSAISQYLSGAPSKRQ